MPIIKFGERAGQNFILKLWAIVMQIFGDGPAEAGRAVRSLALWQFKSTLIGILKLRASQIKQRGGNKQQFKRLNCKFRNILGDQSPGKPSKSSLLLGRKRPLVLFTLFQFPPTKTLRRRTLLPCIPFSNVLPGIN